MFVISWKDDSGNEQSVTFDALKDESFSREVDITEHPVETGANISDHVRPKVAQLRVSGVLTDALREVFTSGSIVTRARPGRALANFKQLEALRDAATLVTVTTPARKHENMLIQSLSWTRDSTVTTAGKPLLIRQTVAGSSRKIGDNINGSGALRISMALREVILVSSQTTEIKTTVPAAKPKVAGGKQTGEAAKPAEISKSWLYQAKEEISGQLDALKKVPVQ